ncbi:4'-phosphopantetheinyl transferase [Micromonospora matsumotoense]|uniref:4'-phosphopantetheinyl transferase n=1 Tax=Micromonospora matsumotoense TaxID=121616 RepID=A0A1C5AJR0_9ACTN|nr:4'-phosphopantetheinyl transferase superfamily protein [Micromonospora matsumotoense]SCF45311.1 4'-phosphopantetheinyl transferase [Micromonospora matsumotoense]
MRDAVRIWIVSTRVGPDELARHHALLDADERARAAALTQPATRDRFTVAHGALRLLVGRALDVPPERLSWRRGRHGKPTLTRPRGGPQTSLSYSDDLVAVAVGGDRAVGVDIQHPTPGLDPVALADRFFAAEEARQVASGADAATRADRFARLWARKEAVVKAAGGRLWPHLALPVHRDDVVRCGDPAGVHRVTDVATPGGYRVAVALAGDAPYDVATAHGLTG